MGVTVDKSLPALLAWPVLLAGSLVAFLQVQPWLWMPFNDWRWYAQAWPRLTSDAPLYDPALFQPHVVPTPDLMAFEQLPAVALVSVFSLLPGAHIWWGLLMAACAVAGLRLVWPPLERHWSLMLAGVVIAWLPVSMLLLWANLNSAVLLLLAVALRFPRHAGWAIGLAGAMKLLPLLALPWLWRTQGWRPVVIAVGVLAALNGAVAVIEGPGVLADFVTVRAMQTAPDHPMRWGLGPLGVPELAIMGLAGILAVVAGWRRSFGLAVAAMVAGVPVPHAHYYAWLLVPLLPAVTQLVGSSRQSLRLPGFRSVTSDAEGLVQPRRTPSRT